ncbi:hypothetical protein F8388_026886, partial [Cannabis sativa]
MSGERPRRGVLPPAQENIEKLKKVVEEGNYYGAQQMYKSISARYVSAQRFSEALDIIHSGACIQLDNGQIPVPQHLADDDDVQQLSEALGAAKTRVDGCSSFLKAAIRWSAEFGAPRNGSPELHVMLAEYIYSESPEVDMTRVSNHFIRGNNPKKFASVLVNFMGKCYPGEDDLAISRAILMLQRDALPLFNMLKVKYKSCIDRDPSFKELLDDIAEKFYGVRRRNPLQGMFGDIFKLICKTSG